MQSEVDLAGMRCIGSPRNVTVLFRGKEARVVCYLVGTVRIRPMPERLSPRVDLAQVLVLIGSNDVRWLDH